MDNEIIANFLNIVKNNYANFEGRARRKEYWYFYLVNVAISVIFAILGAILGSIAEFLGSIISIISMLVSLGLLVPGIAVGVRRMHDVGKSGWFLIIPIYNLILAVTEGDKGSNEYGADPKANEAK